MPQAPVALLPRRLTERVPLRVCLAVCWRGSENCLQLGGPRFRRTYGEEAVPVL